MAIANAIICIGHMSLTQLALIAGHTREVDYSIVITALVKTAVAKIVVGQCTVLMG